MKNPIPKLTLQGRALYRVMSISCAIVGKMITKSEQSITNTCYKAFTMFGYDAGVLGGIQETAPFRNAIGVRLGYHPLQTLLIGSQNPPGAYIIPMIASSYTLACWVSSTIYMWIGQPLGRRRTILLGDAFVIVGGSLQASSWSVPQIIIARVLCGFGIGLISCAVITYMSEMSITKSERGMEAANQSIWLIGGVALGTGFHYLTTSIRGLTVNSLLA